MQSQSGVEPQEADREKADELVDEVLARGELEALGQIREASNATLVCDAELDGITVRCVYKPIRGEQPLWDFPDGTLAGREVASYLIDRALGWNLIPRTIMRDGPYGQGMVQRWIDTDSRPEHDGPEHDGLELVDLCRPDDVTDGFMRVLSAVGPDNQPLVLVHADDPRLRRLAILDVLINNADRKGGHVLGSADGAIYGVDHGICLHADDKLRTVLWGWAGSEIDAEELAPVKGLAGELESGRLKTELAPLITGDEIAALRARTRNLLRHPVFPTPDRPRPIPWPPF